jgi:DNA-binding NarL/FixJ family response regulator
MSFTWTAFRTLVAAFPLIRQAREMWFSKKKTIHDLKSTINREQLVRRSRLLIIDDEEPELIEDLKGAGFSVDYKADVDKTNQTIFERQIYDLVLLDFGNVGKAFGGDEGLSLLKYIKRVCPSTVVLTYTSKSLPTAHADFYRLADGTLSKDAGIQDSTEKIEEGLRRAWSVEKMWKGFLEKCNITPGSDADIQLQNQLAGAIGNSKKEKGFTATVIGLAGNADVQKFCEHLFVKIAEAMVKPTDAG